MHWAAEPAGTAYPQNAAGALNNLSADEGREAGLQAGEGGWAAGGVGPAPRWLLV